MCPAVQQAGVRGEANSGKLREGDQALAPWLCVSVRNSICHTTMAAPLCFVTAQVTALTWSSHWSLQKCSLTVFASPGWRECHPQPDYSPLSPTMRSGLQGCVSHFFELFFLFASPVHSFRYFNAWISQACLCIEQGIFCWIIAVQIIGISGGSLTLPFFDVTPLYLMHFQTVLMSYSIIITYTNHLTFCKLSP